MSRASSLERKATIPAADSSVTHFVVSAWGIAARFAGVSSVLGSIALTRTPRSRTSAAAACARATTAAFDAAYAAAPALVHGSTAARDPTTTTLPRPPATIGGSRARRPRYTVSTLAVIIVRQTSSVSSSYMGRPPRQAPA